MAQETRRPKFRKRVVAIFIIAVMLPCLFLSYVGLKSIKQEKQWQQQLVLQNLKSSLALTLHRIEATAEDQIRSSFNSFPLPLLPLSPASIRSLRRFSQEGFLVDYVFLLDKEMRLFYPRTFRDYSGLEFSIRTSSKIKENEQLRKGESLEAQGQLDDALKEYQQGLSDKLPPFERMAITMRIARCQFKKNDFQSARTTYLKVIAEDRKNFYGEEIPYILIAYSQLLGISEKMESARSGAQLLTDFYAMLLEHFVEFDQAQFNFYLDQVKAESQSIQNIAGRLDVSRWDSLRALEKEIESEQMLHQVLQSNVIPLIQQEAKMAQPIVRQNKTGESLSNDRSSSRLRYLSVKVDSILWPIVMMEKNDGDSPIKLIGFKIRMSALEDFLRSILDQTSERENVKIALLDPGNHIIYPEQLSKSAIILSSPFSHLGELFPGHSLALVASGENPLEAIASKSLLIYYILVVSVIGLIALGVVLMFRDISREERLSQMKSDFIANVSHEIKTPIATIRTLGENLNEGWVSDPEKQREYFRLIAREGERLSHLVENILDFSRIEAKRKTYHREFVPIADVIEKSIERFKLLVEGQDVKLTVHVVPHLPRVNIDSAVIEQAIINLLDNAAKYSRDEKSIDVSAEATQDYCAIKVADHGIGIEKKEIPKLFDKFYRVEPSKGKNIPGSGIGLTLVKEIMEAHGGRVEVESELNKGSTFMLVIPINCVLSDGNNPAR